MARTVTAVVTHEGTCAGSIGPFAVDDPWWAEVEPVVAHLERELGGPAMVLRLLSVEGSDGARDGHVTYLVEALNPPRALSTCEFVDVDSPLRMPWARPAGLAELLSWAGEQVEVTGPPVQRKTWNLAGLFRLPVARSTGPTGPTGPAQVWLKALPPFAAAEPAAIAALASVDPGLVPVVRAAGRGRMLLADVPGRDGWDATPAEVATTLQRLVRAQARLADRRPAGLPDRGLEYLASAVAGLLDGPVGAELTVAELAAARALQPDWERLAGCGLPDTLVHGDFHPGNWRLHEAGCVVLDLADSHWGNPVLDGARAVDHLPLEHRAGAARAWVDAWVRAAPGSRPAPALRIAARLAHLAYAVRYQEFLDGIETSERVYHRGDPAAAIRRALL